MTINPMTTGFADYDGSAPKIWEQLTEIGNAHATADSALAEIHAMRDRAIAEINLKVSALIRSDAQKLRRWKERSCKENENL